MKCILYFYAVIVSLLLAAAVRVFPYSFNAFNGMTGKGTVSLAPTISCPISPAFGTAVDLIGSYGFTPNFDLFADAADFSLAPQAGYAYSWIMPRFEFLPGNILGLQLQLNNSQPMSYGIAPQYHFFYENDGLALEFNGVFTYPVNNTNASPAVSGILAPVWKAVKDILYPFIEIDPSYTFGNNSGFHLNIVPGFWIGIPDTPHQFCLAFTLSDVTSGAVGYGVSFWYSVSFGLIKDSPEEINNKE